MLLETSQQDKVRAKQSSNKVLSQTTEFTNNSATATNQQIAQWSSGNEHTILWASIFPDNQIKSGMGYPGAKVRVFQEVRGVWFTETQIWPFFIEEAEECQDVTWS